MEIASTCLALAAVLNVTPSKTQFFFFDTITFNCSVHAGSGPAPGSGGWLLRRTLSRSNDTGLCSNDTGLCSNNTALCSSDRGWGQPGPMSCTIVEAYPSDSGVYWCESEGGQCSSSVNITVTGGEVILESPPQPVMEGQNVTLRCSHKDEQLDVVSSDFSSNFSQGKVWVGSGVGQLTLTSVSRSDAGFYRCSHPSLGKSPPSWLHVTVAPPPPCCHPWPLPVGLLLVKLHGAIIVAICILHRCRICKGC